MNIIPIFVKRCIGGHIEQMTALLWFISSGRSLHSLIIYLMAGASLRYIHRQLPVPNSSRGVNWNHFSLSLLASLTVSLT